MGSRPATGEKQPAVRPAPALGCLCFPTDSIFSDAIVLFHQVELLFCHHFGRLCMQLQSDVVSSVRHICLCFDIIYQMPVLSIALHVSASNSSCCSKPLRCWRWLARGLDSLVADVAVTIFCLGVSISRNQKERTWSKLSCVTTERPLELVQSGVSCRL